MKKYFEKCFNLVKNVKVLQTNSKKTVSFMIVFFSIGLFMTLCGCSSAPGSSSGGLFDGRSNLNQGGFVSMAGDSIYYCKIVDDYGLYKSSIDGTEKTRIADGACSNINVIDGWIYYKVENNTDSSYENGILKIRTDGSNRTQIQAVEGSDSLYNVNVVDDWAYYFICEKDYFYSLNKTRTDGTQKTVLLKAISRPESLSVVGNWIYYTNSTQTGTDIFKIRTDGTEQTKIGNGKGIQYLNISGDWIYYSGYSDDGTTAIYKIRTDGSDQLKITDDISAFANVLGDWIYYVSYSYEDEKPSLNKINTNGSGQSKVVDLADEGIIGDVGYLNITGNWIYFLSSNVSSETVQYKIHTDGTGLTKVE